MVCTFQKSCHLLKLSKMLMGNICNWLLQGDGAVTRVLVYYKILILVSYEACSETIETIAILSNHLNSILNKVHIH